MIGVIDIGVGNTASVTNSLLQIGVYPVPVRNGADLSRCTHVIMPGVGHFDSVILALRENDLYEHLAQFIKSPNKSYLGICVGMQILFTRSEEGSEPGLGVFGGTVKRFTKPAGRFLPPNMGKSKLKGSNPLLSSLNCYFMHSYAVTDCENSMLDLYLSSYCGQNFVGLVRRDRIWGAQFHPERSGVDGLSFFKEFLS